MIYRHKKNLFMNLNIRDKEICIKTWKESLTPSVNGLTGSQEKNDALYTKCITKLIYLTMMCIVLNLIYIFFSKFIHKKWRVVIHKTMLKEHIALLSITELCVFSYFHHALVFIQTRRGWFACFFCC